MATPAENLQRFQEISNRGLQDNLDPDKRARFDEALKRGLITQEAPQQQVQPGGFDIGRALSGVGERVAGGVETAAAIGSGIIAEPVAGIAGIAQAVNPFAAPGAGAKAVETVREALTIEPRTKSGQRGAAGFAKALEKPAEALTKAEGFLGDKTLEKTGSPALAAAAITIPTAISELLGVGLSKGAVQAAKAQKARAAKGQIARSIEEAAPSIDQLKDTSRAVYKEIDDLGVTVQRKAFEGLVNKIKKEAKKIGLDPDITPKASKAIQRFEEAAGKDVSLSDIDTIRSVAQKAANTIEKGDAAIGVNIINTVDDFLDQLGPTAFKRPQGVAPDIGSRYKTARDLWGRARRSELLEEAFFKARNQASGFQNGLVTQFRTILNNPKTRKFFKPDELKAIETVVRGDTKTNIAKLIGKLGFTEGGATNFLGGAIGTGAGAAVAGAPGAVIVPLVGQISKKLAQRMTQKNAEFANQVIRAGKNAREITQAYIRNTPKSKRSAQELSELLQRPDIDLNDIPGVDIATQAAALAAENRAALAAGATAGAIVPEEEQ